LKLRSGFLPAILAPLLLGARGDGLPREIRTESGVKMVAVPAGWFMMGEKGREADEKIHKVYLSSFCIDKYPVTQEEYERVMGENPSKWKGRKNPAEQMRWADAVRYCNARSKLEGLKPCYDLETWKCDFAADGYRLPTEAEWERACRAGTRTRYSFGDGAEKLAQYGWFKDNSGGRPRPVGQKTPNPWSLFDMHGNVWEWCNDFYRADYYRASPERDPRGPASGKTRVLRGGCWDSSADRCRSSCRYHENPAYADVCFGYDIYGFRCARGFSREVRRP
jgi:formylglycine-generating enzyme required for sulfatase activity